jgi:hypothetical protein
MYLINYVNFDNTIITALILATQCTIHFQKCVIDTLSVSLAMETKISSINY